MEKSYLTKEKYDEFVVELNELKTSKRQEVAKNLEYARSLGDLSENAEYHDARDAQAKLEDRINHIEEIIKNAEIIKKHHSEVVEMGSSVIVRKKGDKNKKEFDVVGPEEADTLAGKISHTSPLGKAILGTKKNEVFTFVTPKGSVEYKVLDIK